MTGRDGGPTVVVVTGANRGLGHALATAFLARDDTRVVMAVRDATREEPCRELLHGREERGLIVHLDYDDDGSITQAAKTISASYERVDVLVNCGGRNVAPGRPREASKGPLAALDVAAVADLVRTNALGPLATCQALLPCLERSGRPRVLNVSSRVGSLSQATYARSLGYAMSKAALNMATRKIAAELESIGGIALCVDPGWLRTDMGGADAPGDPDAVAAAMVELALGASPPDNGSFVGPDGEPVPW